MVDGDLTDLLRAWRDGSVDARDRLVTLLYHELHRRATAYLRRERKNHTLQPTALVNEVYLRLVNQRRADWQNRAQFLAVAAQMMRRIIVDHERARRMAKRSGRWWRVSLSEAVGWAPAADTDALDLDAALTQLSAFDPRKSRIAELRFFAGLSLEETGHVLGLSVATVERDWRAARAWLYAALKGTPSRDTRSMARGH